MVLALEGIGGEVALPPGAGRVEGVPVHADPGDVEGAEAGEDLREVVAVAPQRPDPRALGGRQARLPGADQHRMRAELDEGPDPETAERRHPGREAHRREHVTHPVVRRAHLGTDELAAHVGDDPPPGRREVDAGGDVGERVQHRRHQR